MIDTRRLEVDERPDVGVPEHLEPGDHGSLHARPLCGIRRCAR
jgi:hypothetical protein